MRKANRARAKCVSAESSANPALPFAALLPLTILEIVAAGLSRDSLKKPGVVINSEVNAAQFVGPWFSSSASETWH